MATYKYRQNLSGGASAGYVEYNIAPDFGTVLAPGETFEITGKIYSGKKIYGISVEAVHIGSSAWYRELIKVEKTISAGKSATFAAGLLAPDLSDIETAERQVLPTYINFGFLINSDLDVGETTDRYDDQRLALIKDRLAPSVTGVALSDYTGAYAHFGGAVQGKSDLSAALEVLLDPLDPSLRIERAEIAFAEADGFYTNRIYVQQDAISGNVLHIGTPTINGVYRGYALTITDSKGKSSMYFGDAITIYPYASPRLYAVDDKDLAERYEVNTDDAGVENVQQSDSGTYLWANFAADVTPINGKNRWQIIRSWAEYGNEPAREAVADAFADGTQIRVFENQDIFPRNIIFAENMRYTVQIEIRDYFESAVLRFDVDKAGGYFNIEKFGVAAGMRSTASWDKPKFESAYPVYPYKGIAMCPEAVAEIPLDLDASGQFRLYKAGVSPFCLMRYGNIVYLDGEITPASSITGNAEEHIVATMPEGFAPKYSRTYLCQGTGTALWMLRVYAADNEEYPSKITFGRYRSGGSYANCNAGNWLPISVSWICGGTVVQEDDGTVKLIVSADGAAMIEGTELTVDADGSANIPMEYLSVYADGAAVIG